MALNLKDPASRAAWVYGQHAKNLPPVLSTLTGTIRQMVGRFFA